MLCEPVAAAEAGRRQAAVMFRQRGEDQLLEAFGGEMPSSTPAVGKVKSGE